MPPEQFITKMRKAGVNVFPEEDAHKFVSINEKVLGIVHHHEVAGIWEKPENLLPYLLFYISGYTGGKFSQNM